jgi:hypothetical protein
MAGADLMGKAYATEETQRLLFDLSRRRNFFDVMRLLLPFGEAWNEIITTWRRLLVDNPAIIRRGSQALNGARSSGFIYTDPGTGEEVFNYGGAYGPESLGQLLFGGDVNLLPLGGDRAVATLTGRVAGLNLVSGNWLPGFGPVVQLPLAQLDWVQTDPKWEWFRELVFPFGAPEADTPGALADSLLPTWVKRGLAAIGRPVGSDVRSFNYTVVDTIRAMKLSGEWKDSTQAEINTSLRIATDRAKSLYFIRALSAFVGPTPAGVRWDAKLDPDGRLLAFTVLAQEYRAIREQTRAAGGQDTDAFDTFVQRFGVDPLLFSTAKSTTLVSRSVTKEGVDFQASHQELFADFPLTAYFALPDPVDGTFDQRAYTSQFLDQPGIGAPARVPLTPAQWTELHNQLAGEMMYERAKRAVDGRSDEAAQAWLRAVKAQIMEAYPGFGGDIVGTPTRARREEMIVELYGWRADPFLAETETGRGLALYLAARDLVAVESAKRGIVGWQRAEGTTDLRSWLATVAQSVMMKLPEFAAVYDRVLSSEVEIPGEEPSTELAGISLQPVSP